MEEEGTPQYDFEQVTHKPCYFLIRAFYCQSNLFQDTKLLELFKDDAFSVASEIQRRAEEGCIANPNTSRGRPIYTDSARGRYFYNPCLRKGPQLRTWSS